MIQGKLAIAGLVIIVALVLCALLAPWLAPFDPNAPDLDGDLEPPNGAHIMGQDELGRDILSRAIWGTRASMLVGFTVVGISLFFGVLIGSIAGYAGGLVDSFIMRIVDVLLAFPGILLAIAVAGILGPSLGNVIIALCLLGWVGFARLVRGQILSVREREYVVAARVTGAGPFRIVTRHVLPNVLAPVIVQATFGIATTILAEASLSFLGLGPQNVPTWGGMLNNGVDYLMFAPHLSIFPGLMVMITVLAFNFLGDGLRDALDPKSRIQQ
jgi:peptide/nickel transport system permease protein